MLFFSQSMVGGHYGVNICHAKLHVELVSERGAEHVTVHAPYTEEESVKAKVWKQSHAMEENHVLVCNQWDTKKVLSPFRSPKNHFGKKSVVYPYDPGNLLFFI